MTPYEGDGYEVERTAVHGAGRIETGFQDGTADRFSDGLTGVFANAAAGSDRVEHRIVFQHKAHLFLMVFPMKAPEGVPAVRSQKSAI